MAMRETPRSVRAYLIFVGVVGAIINIVPLLIYGTNPVLVGVSLIGVGFAGLYFYLGLRFMKLLPRSSKTIVRGLIAGACYLLVVALLELLSGGSWAGAIRSVIGLLITWYLITNVRRLGATPA